MIYDNIKSICREKGVTVSRMEDELDLPSGSMRKWNKNEPGVGRVKRVADYLGVSMDSLVSKEVENGQGKDGEDL